MAGDTDSNKKSKNKNPHSKHRERMKNKYIKNGIDQFDLHEVLEMLLYYAIPMRDTNPLAHRLMDEFGSFSGVFDASVDELAKAGISRNVAFYIKFILAAQERYACRKCDIAGNRLSYDEIGDLLSDILRPYDSGHIAVVLTNSANSIVYKGVIKNITLNGDNMKTALAAIERECYRNITAYVSVAYRSSNEYTLPRVVDIELAAKLTESLKRTYINFIDYFIITDYDTVSMKSLNLLFENSKELEESGVIKPNDNPERFVFPRISDIIINGNLL